MPADRAIDRAMVHAGGAADAAQHLLEIRAEHVGAPIVDQHDMVFLGPVQVGRPTHAGREGGVDGEILARCAAREQPQQRRAILQRRDDLLDAGQRDMDARQGLGQVAIALIGHDHAAAGFGDQKIRPRDADIGGEEFLPQLGARLGQDVAPFVEHAVGRQVGVQPAEIRLPILAVQVEGRGDDVGGVLVAELQDVLAKIGLDRRDAVGFQMVVDAELLGDHRLALGDRLRAGGAANLKYGGAGVVGGAAPMDLAAGRLHLCLEGFEVEVEMGQGMVLDVAADVAELFEFRQPRHRIGAALQEGALGGAERLLQPGIGQCARRVLLEGGRGDGDHGDTPCLPYLARAGEAR